MDKSKVKKIFYSLLLPLLVGSVSAIIVNKLSSFNPYEYTPSFMPKPIIFIVVWTLLYILMGYSNYLINNQAIDNLDDEDAISSANHTYYFSLAINFIYSIIFFVVKWPFIAFLVCIYLTILVIQTICQYHEINKLAAYLNIPYALWTAFASVLTFSFWWLNW